MGLLHRLTDVIEPVAVVRRRNRRTRARRERQVDAAVRFPRFPTHETTGDLSLHPVGAVPRSTGRGGAAFVFLPASDAAAKLHCMGRAANTNDDNPCLSHDGVRKERWPNALAAWYVVELCLRGKHGRMTAGKKMYAYHCTNPECDGWHLATCRNREDRRRHRRGLEELRRRMKTSQRAGKKKGRT